MEMNKFSFYHMLGFMICTAGTRSIAFGRPWLGNKPVVQSLCKKHCRKCHRRSCNPLVAVFDGGGGIFGVGTSELVVIGIVAWVVLGPKRLYALSKDLGRIFGELRQSAEQAKTTLVAALESELEESDTNNTNKPLTNHKENVDEHHELETKLQDKVQWDDESVPPQKVESSSVRRETVDTDRKVFLEQLERLNSSNPQPPEYASFLHVSQVKTDIRRELPEILKKISSFGEDVDNREHSSHSTVENTDMDSELAQLDKKYQELRNEIIQKKKLKE
jgi:Tat protein translocase TatB subunit